MYEDEFELTFQVPEEESAPEPLAAPAAKPASPMEPVADEPTRIMTLGKTAAPVVDEPTRVITLEKPAEPSAPEPTTEPAPEPVKEQPAPAAPAAVRRVLISGGDRGIGAAAARAFAAAGYQVAVLYHQNAAAAAALEQQLPGCIAIQCDVASRASCELAFHAVEQAMGRVDVLVCNAGIAQQKLFTDITSEEWQRMLDVNLSGVPPVPAGTARHDPPQAGPHSDREQYVGPDRRQLRGALFRREGRAHRPDQSTGEGRGPQWHYGELRSARGHRD